MKYELVNGNMPNKTIAALTNYRKKAGDLEGIFTGGSSISSTLCLFQERVAAIKEAQAERLKYFEMYLNFDNLYVIEALYLLLGLNPKATEQLPDLQFEDYFELLGYFFNESSENTLLYRKYLKGWGDTINTENFIEWAIKRGFFREVKASTNKPKATVKEKKIGTLKRQRQSTINQQNHINDIAKDLVVKHPKIKKEWLAMEISIKLIEQQQTKLKASTIERDYLKKYPNFN